MWTGSRNSTATNPRNLEPLGLQPRRSPHQYAQLLMAAGSGDGAQILELSFRCWFVF